MLSGEKGAGSDRRFCLILPQTDVMLPRWPTSRIYRLRAPDFSCSNSWASVCMLASFFVIGCCGPYSCSASPFIRQISDRSLPISLVTYLRFCSVMGLAAPPGPSMPSPKIVLAFYLFRDTQTPKGIFCRLWEWSNRYPAAWLFPLRCS